MKSNTKLVQAARDVLNQFPWRQREKVERLIADYDVACVLSEGADAARSKHWQVKAVDALQDLWRGVRHMLDDCDFAAEMAHLEVADCGQAVLT